MLPLSRDDPHIAWVNLTHFEATEHSQCTQNLCHPKHLINLLEFQILELGQAKQSLCIQFLQRLFLCQILNSAEKTKYWDIVKIKVPELNMTVRMYLLYSKSFPVYQFRFHTIWSQLRLMAKRVTQSYSWSTELKEATRLHWRWVCVLVLAQSPHHLLKHPIGHLREYGNPLHHYAEIAFR